MALSPIKMFQSDQSSLAQILAGGNQTISGIMDGAIQIGRDMSNKQLAQERDMLAMRQQETALSQRRAENLQQNMEDAIRFARGAFESDRRYGMEQQQEQRMTDRDLFSRGMEEDRLGLAKEGLELRRDAMTAEQQAKEDEKKAAEDRARRTAAMFGLGDETAAAPDDRTLGKKFEQTGKALYGGVKDLLAGRPVNVQKPPTPAGAAEAPKLPPGVSQQAYDAARETMLDPNASAMDKRIALDIIRPKGSEEADGETAAGRRAARSLEMREQALQDKNAQDEIKLLVGDTKAFLPQTPQVMRKAGGYTEADQSEAKAYDADRVASEINSAQNYGEEEYVNFKGMTLSESQKAKRRKLWQYANRKAGTSPTTSAVDMIPGIGD